MKSVIIFLLTTNLYAQDSTQFSQGSNSLTREFIEKLCEATEIKDEKEPAPLEQLINDAAGTYFKDSLQAEKVYSWWNKHYTELYCPVSRKDSIHLARVIIEKDLRIIANQLGPHGRLSLNLELRDPVDNLTLREFVKQGRESRASKYKNQTLRFQKDKKWKNYSFYLMLITHYEVEWVVLRSQDN